MLMWKEENNKLIKDFTFKDFVQAFGFISQVAILAEKQNHHPFWTNMYNQVHFELSTHDAGDKVTDKDRDLAKKIDEVANSFSS